MSLTQSIPVHPSALRPSDLLCASDVISLFTSLYARVCHLGLRDAPCWFLLGNHAIIRRGPPLPLPIFIGKAMIMDPEIGKRLISATFSNAGISCLAHWERGDGPTAVPSQFSQLVALASGSHAVLCARPVALFDGEDTGETRIESPNMYCPG